MTIPTIKHIVEGRPRYTVSQHQTVFSAVVYMSEKQVGGVAVLDGERLVGIFTERDLMKRVVARRQDPHRTLVSEVMTRSGREAAGIGFDPGLAGGGDPGKGRGNRVDDGFHLFPRFGQQGSLRPRRSLRIGSRGP